jgi:hypothetical protein
MEEKQMIFLYLGLFFGFIWWIANTHLKEQFNPYLKYSAIFFIAILIATDVFFFIETDRFYKAKAVGGDLGIGYSYYNNGTNLTVVHTMYAKQDEDAGTVMAYHWAEFGVMPYIVMMLPYVAMFVAVTLALQYIYLTWRASYYGISKTKEKDKNDTY